MTTSLQSRWHMMIPGHVQTGIDASRVAPHRFGHAGATAWIRQVSYKFPITNGLKCVVMTALILLSAGCAPPDRTMPVAYVRDVFYNLRPDKWDYGEVKECQIASRKTEKPDDRGDLLLCGGETLTGWSMSWLRPDVKTQIYENARTFAVTFRSAGHSRRGATTRWLCRRTPDKIECD